MSATTTPSLKSVIDERDEFHRWYVELHDAYLTKCAMLDAIRAVIERKAVA